MRLFRADRFRLCCDEKCARSGRMMKLYEIVRDDFGSFAISVGTDRSHWELAYRASGISMNAPLENKADHSLPLRHCTRIITTRLESARLMQIELGMKLERSKSSSSR